MKVDFQNALFSLGFWNLVFVKVKLNLKSEASKNYLNYLWWILEPALYVAVFYVVFKIFLNKGSDGFLVFLICGKIPYIWFSRTIQNSCNAIFGGSGLMHQIKIPMIFFPSVVVFQDLAKSLLLIVVMLVYLFVDGSLKTDTIFYLLPLLITQFVLVYSLASFSAAIVPIIPDARFLISTGLMLLMFGSGIFYDYKLAILPEHHSIFLANPVASLISMYREILLNGKVPDIVSMAYIFFASTGFLLSIHLILKKIGGIYPRLVQK